MSTVKARKLDAQWDYVGEGFMKEIDFGLVWLRLNEASEGDKDDVVAEWKGDAKAFLQATLVSFCDSHLCLILRLECVAEGSAYICAE